MRGQHHFGSRYITITALGGALALAALPGTALATADDVASLPRCAELGASDDGEVSSPWQAVLDDDGALTGYSLTLRDGADERRLRTSRRGFMVRVGSDRLLIGERTETGTRLDMVDTGRLCRLWIRRHDRLLYPVRDSASGPLPLSAHDRGSRRYEGIELVDPESGATQATVDEACVELCLPTDGDVGLAALEPAGAARPTPSFSAGGWPKGKRLTFRWKSGATPPSWARGPLMNGADDASLSARAQSPRFAFDLLGANSVAYTGSLPSFCGITAIACASRNMPTFWGVWIRPHGTDYSWGTLRWCQKTSSSSGCFDIRRVMLHELGHVAGLNHPSSAGFTLSTSDSIMQGITPARPQAGASRHDFGRCDVATLQELYDTPDNKTAISTCNDVVTTISLASSASSVVRGQAVKLTATLKVADKGAYDQLAANPLNGRSVKLKYRPSGSDDAWKTVWMRALYQQGRYETTLVPGSSWEFKAVFSKPADEGLRYSRSEIRKVKVAG
jgi:hypothetical protein